eukprot:TRINITY_DN731_c0_g2_i6.p1 TRINITY_DN731_c0_g2~~TRINITY_DN731_c0_g2_i6.p1  ORF type:complete len:153 (+),score=45.89 TRINITY_DN731_c0_g2_i6:141-599(+)
MSANFQVVLKPVATSLQAIPAYSPEAAGLDIEGDHGPAAGEKLTLGGRELTGATEEDAGVTLVASTRAGRFLGRALKCVGFVALLSGSMALGWIAFSLTGGRQLQAPEKPLAVPPPPPAAADVNNSTEEVSYSLAVASEDVFHSSEHSEELV